MFIDFSCKKYKMKKGKLLEEICFWKFGCDDGVLN